MRATITSTPIIAELDGVKVRVWNGVTAAGVCFTAFIHQVAVAESANREDFDRELIEHSEPSSVTIVANRDIPRQLAAGWVWYRDPLSGQMWPGPAVGDAELAPPGARKL